MYEDNLDINISPAYEEEEFIEDLKAELEGEIDALLLQGQIDDVMAKRRLEPTVALERIREIRKIMKKLNLV